MFSQCFRCFSFALFFAFVLFVNAHSQFPRPITRLAHPSVRLLHAPGRPTYTAWHSDTFQLVVDAFGQTFYLNLAPNNHLLHPDAAVTYHLADGTTRREMISRNEVRAYQGNVVDGRGVRGWARVVVHDVGDISSGVQPLFEGAFQDGGIQYHVLTTDHYLRTKRSLDADVDPDAGPLVIWRETDLADGDDATSMCAHDKLPYNVDPLQNPMLRRRRSFFSRDDAQGGGVDTNFADTIGSTDGCPKTQDILYMGVAADCEYVQLAGGGASNATKQILTSWNTVSALYKSTFNISLGIVELELQDATCGSNTSSAWGVACSDNVTLNDRLSLFSKWRGERSGDDIGLWHLMSGCPTGTEIGIAWLSTLCQQISTRSSDSYVSGTAVSTAGTTEWQVVAHEIGHNFGAIHDCTSGCNSTSACCPLSTSACDADSKYIMNPATKSSENTFSQCSIGNICTMMRGTSGESLNTTCLVPASDAATNGRPLISLQMCGNGIVEDGEECDPGYNVTSACCDTSTCKFKDGATCDPLSSNGGCCTDSCGLRQSGYVCRAAKDVACDFAETCTGNSSSCPADKYKTDGTSCGGNNLKCASGLCTSRSLQCQNLGASSGLEKACTKKDDTSCLVSCQDPSHANACISLNSQLIDGSPCGYGGACYSGVCKSADALTTAKAWYTQNLKIAIPVTIIAAVVILCILWFLFVCIRRCCVRRRVRPLEPGRRQPFVPLPSTHFVGDSDSSGSLLVPKETRPRAIRRISRNRTEVGLPPRWVDDTPYNGPRR